jgi:hypothetical protein
MTPRFPQSGLQRGFGSDAPSRSDATRIVCATLILALTVLACRIISVW